MQAPGPTAAVEADIAALKRAAERAGSALACLFSSVEELESEIVRERKAERHHVPRRHLRRTAGRAVLTLGVSLALLLV